MVGGGSWVGGGEGTAAVVAGNVAGGDVDVDVDVGRGWVGLV